MLNTVKSTLGKIFVGDISYAMDDQYYNGYWADLYGYSDGHYPVSEWNTSFAVFGTAFGDGSYLGSDSNRYSVDAGVIGLVPKELWKEDITDEELNKLGTVVEANELNVEVNDKGTFFITGDNISIEIVTGNEENKDEEDF